MCWRFMFGYRVSKENGIKIDPVEGPIAQEVFRHIANGASLNSVVCWLNRTKHYGALGEKWKTSRLKEMDSLIVQTGESRKWKKQTKPI